MPIYRVPVEMTWNGPGSPGVNVFHIRVASGAAGGSAALQAGVDSVHTFYAALLAGGGGFGGCFASNTQFLLGQVVDVETQEVASPTWTTLAQGASGNAAAQALQVVIGWRTSIAARRGQGRTFVGPLNAGTAAPDGSIASVTRTNVLNAASALATRNKQDNGWGVGIYGLQTAKTGPTGAKVLRDITSATVGTQFSVLRSRRD